MENKCAYNFANILLCEFALENVLVVCALSKTKF